MYRQEMARIKVMCDDANCLGDCGLFHTVNKRTKSAEARSSRSSSNAPPSRPSKAKGSDRVVRKVKRKKQSPKKVKQKETTPVTSPPADGVIYDEWTRLGQEIHDEQHFFPPTTSVTNSTVSLNSSETSNRTSRNNHNRKSISTVRIQEDIHEVDGAEKGKDNEWELLKDELIVKDDAEKARLFVAEELERQRRSMTPPEAETTLDDIIEAARRKSVAYVPGTGSSKSHKRKQRNTLLGPPPREDGGSSVQAILNDEHFATQLLDSDEEGGIVGDPPSTIDDDLDLDHILQAAKPPQDAFSNPIDKPADPLAKQLSRSRAKKKTVTDDEMSVDFSVVDLSVTSRLSFDSAYDDVDMLSSAIHAMATRTPDAEYVGSLL